MNRAGTVNYCSVNRVLDLTQADDITLDNDTDEGFKISVSMSEHMETFGMRALSQDDEVDNGEEDLGAPEDEDDNNDDEEPGQVWMYVCCVCSLSQSGYVRVLEAVQPMQEPPPVPLMQVLYHHRSQRDLKSREEGTD